MLKKMLSLNLRSDLACYDYNGKTTGENANFTTTAESLKNFFLTYEFDLATIENLLQKILEKYTYRADELYLVIQNLTEQVKTHFNGSSKQELEQLLEIINLAVNNRTRLPEVIKSLNERTNTWPTPALSPRATKNPNYIIF